MATATETHSTTSGLIDPNQIASVFIEAIPGIGEADQRLARTLYQMLSRGKPVSFADLAKVLSCPTNELSETLNNWPGVFYSDNKDVIGFWGITVKPMGHQMEIDGVTTYTWCAWDSLFIPELVGATARITSKCEQSGEEIKLSVSSDGASSETHNDIVVSFVIPTAEELRTNATASFCHFVYFFKDRQAGEAWLENHEDAFLLTLNEAFAAGKILNAARFNLASN